MRENRPYGLEGGEAGSTGLPYPYAFFTQAAQTIWGHPSVGVPVFEHEHETEMAKQGETRRLSRFAPPKRTPRDFHHTGERGV